MLDPARAGSSSGARRAPHVQGRDLAVQGVEADRPVLRGHRSRGRPRDPRLRRRRLSRASPEQDSAQETARRPDRGVPRLGARATAASPGRADGRTRVRAALGETRSGCRGRAVSSLRVPGCLPGGGSGLCPARRQDRTRRSLRRLAVGQPLVHALPRRSPARDRARREGVVPDAGRRADVLGKGDAPSRGDLPAR